MTSQHNRPALLLLGFVLFAAPLAARDHWVATWAASPSPLMDEAALRKANLAFDNQTIRQIVHTSIGGKSVRVRLSNAYGNQQVRIAAATIALRSSGSEIVPASTRTLTFSSRPAVTIPRDAIVWSDPVSLSFPDAADLAISLFLPGPTLAAGIHYAAQQTSYTAPGNLVSAPSRNNSATTITSWAFLTSVDVLAPEKTGVVVAFGDSITDGARSTIDANRRWPNILANRLHSANRKLAVVDAGIGGNRILHDAVPASPRFGVNALARFDRDVLSVPGVRYVIVLEGINDIGHPGTSAPAQETVSADDLIAGLRQLIERAHEKGLKIFGGTITPFEGTVFPGYYSPGKDTKRKAVNEWIRSSGAFDGVIDFDKAVRNPSNPARILDAYDGGDRLHPSDAGYAAMGQAVDLNLFR